MFEYFSCIRLPAFSRVDQNTVQTVHARFSALDGSQSHMIGTISLHPVVHIHKIDKGTAATSIRPNPDALHRP